MKGIPVAHLYETLFKFVLQITEDYQYVTFCCDAGNKQSTEHVKHIHLENAFLVISFVDNLIFFQLVLHQNDNVCH